MKIFSVNKLYQSTQRNKYQRVSLFFKHVIVFFLFFVFGRIYISAELRHQEIHIRYVKK